MKQSIKIAILLLRLALGWLFVYAGLSKIIDPTWSASGYLTHATTFSGFYAWLAGPGNIGWVNLLNEWGLLLIGIAIIVGFWVRWASLAGILIMTLYWLAILQFPHVGTTGYLVDQHIIFILVFVLFITTNAGAIWGFDARWSRNN